MTVKPKLKRLTYVTARFFYGNTELFESEEKMICLFGSSGCSPTDTESDGRLWTGVTNNTHLHTHLHTSVCPIVMCGTKQSMRATWRIHDFLCRTVSVLPFSLLRPDVAELPLLFSAFPGALSLSVDPSCRRRRVSLYRSVMSLLTHKYAN